MKLTCLQPGHGGEEQVWKRSPRRGADGLRADAGWRCRLLQFLVLAAPTGV